MRAPLLLLLICAAPTFAAPAPDYAAELARECDQLLATAIKRPYGIAWAAGDVVDDPKRKLPVPVAMDAGQGPAAGLVLLWAGDLLKEPKYAQAARDVARGITAAQHASGRIPAGPLFNAANATSRDPLTALPERGPTRAALALLLALLEGHEKDPANEALARSASRAATWLFRQQAETGGWPVMHPPDAPPAKQTRLVRLDTREFRDSTLAMLLAYEVLGDGLHRRSVERSMEFLDRAKNPDILPAGANLWGPGFTLTGAPVEKIADLPKQTDALASRYAIQTTLGVYLVLGGGPYFIRCERAAKSIAALPKLEGAYHRWYTSRGDPFRPDFVEAAKARFGEDAAVDKRYASDFGLPPVLATVEAIGPGGRDKFLDRMSANFTRNQVLLQTVSGLEDGHIPWNFPPADAAPALAPRLPGEGLEGRVRHAWQLYLLAKAKRAGKT
ncbi:MAG: hypothetical protein ACAI43_13540 [Phycisphaerae bacterium]|nr:hypothetical protein [Tepidisphaeraceae bacterium]